MPMVVASNVCLWNSAHVYRRLGLCISIALLDAALASAADQLVVSDMTWMTEPATANSAAPKLLSDGLHFYAVLCGPGGTPTSCTVLRKRGNEAWEQPGATFTSTQQAVGIIDRKGRLNVFFNDPALRHLRFAHPSVDLETFEEIPFPYSDAVTSFSASYDPAIDLISLAFVEATESTLYFSVKYTDLNVWMVSVADTAPATHKYSLPRTVRATSGYWILATRHPRIPWTSIAAGSGIEAAVLLSSASPAGPWTLRYPECTMGACGTTGIDLQADSTGRIRALIGVTNSFLACPCSWDTPFIQPRGSYLARQENIFRVDSS